MAVVVLGLLVLFSFSLRVPHLICCTMSHGKSATSTILAALIKAKALENAIKLSPAWSDHIKKDYLKISYDHMSILRTRIK